MVTPSVFDDIDKLLAPIPGDNPCGEDVLWGAWTPEVDEIKNCRKARESAVLQAADVQANWPRVIELTTKLLSERTKDIQVACWLGEAVAREHGIAGARDAFRLIHGLVDRYWDRLYPLVEHGDATIRVARFSGLDSIIATQLRMAPLAPSEDDAVVFSHCYYNARVTGPKRRDEKEDSYKARSEAANDKSQQFDRAVAGASREYYVHLYEDVQQTRDQVKQLGQTLTDKLGNDAPGWEKVIDALGDVERVINVALKAKGGLPNDEATVPVPPGEVDVGAASSSDQRGPGGPVRSRADVKLRLQEVIDYFEKHERDSPVRLAVELALNWANASPIELYGALIRNEKLRTAFGLESEK